MRSPSSSSTDAEHYMSNPKNKMPAVIAEFATSYIDSLDAGTCTEEQHVAAFRLTQGGSMILPFEPGTDPSRLVPEQLQPILAHALFVPKSGRVKFRTPANTGGKTRAVEIEDPVYITVAHGAESQLWILGLSEEDMGDDDMLQLYRADPTTIEFTACLTFSGARVLH